MEGREGMEGMDRMGFQVPVGHNDKGEWLEQQALRVPLHQGMVGWSPSSVYNPPYISSHIKNM